MLTAVASELLEGRLRVERSKSRIIEPRRNVERGWRTTIDLLRNQGQSELAESVARFVGAMPPPATEKEIVAGALLGRGFACHTRVSEKDYIFTAYGKR